mgnify:CR=1 FL=1
MPVRKETREQPMCELIVCFVMGMAEQLNNLRIRYII